MTPKYSYKIFFKNRQGAGSAEHFQNPKREDKKTKCSNKRDQIISENLALLQYSTKIHRSG